MARRNGWNQQAQKPQIMSNSRVRIYIVFLRHQARALRYGSNAFKLH